MKQKFKELEHHQIKEKLAWLSAHESFLSRPKEGYIRSLRKVLGMTSLQVAKRLGVTQPRIIELEKAEISGHTTLKTMKEVAESLGCRFEYSFIPQKAIDTLVKERAYAVAAAQVEYVSHQMALEAQNLSAKQKKINIEQVVKELLKTPKKLWD